VKSRPPKNAPAQPAAPPLLQRLGRQLETLGWRLLLGLGLLAFLLAAWTFDPKLALSGDNTEFMTLARSLVQGQGLSYISLPEPKPATKYPFGFPLMLAPLEWLAPGNGAAMNWLVVLFFAGSVPLIYLLALQALGRVPALLASLWCATLPLLLDYAHQVMSEVPYLFFSLLGLWLIERGMGEEERIPGNYWFIGGFAALMWAYYVRSAGIALVGAVFLYLLLRRRFRQALALGGGALLLALPWSLRNRAVGDEGSYFKQLISVNPYFPEQGTVDLAGMVERVLFNGGAYLSRILPQIFWPSAAPPENGALVSVALLGLAGWAVFACIRRRQHLLLPLYAGLYLAMVLVWPSQWTDARFLAPLTPVLVLLAIQGAAELLDWRPQLRPAGRVLAGALLAGVLALNLGALGRLARAGAGDYPPGWRNYYAAGLWLRANTPAGSVICCRKDYWLYVVADRPCMVYPFKEPAEILASLEQQGVDYVVVDQLGFSSTPRFLVPAIQQYPERFEVVWQQPNPDTYVLRFLPAR
jgi:4-amino-4-deoxy-L-arabinose transferase-like glycosyltransferase